MTERPMYYPNEKDLQVKLQNLAKAKGIIETISQNLGNDLGPQKLNFRNPAFLPQDPMERVTESIKRATKVAEVRQYIAGTKIPSIDESIKGIKLSNIQHNVEILRQSRELFTKEELQNLEDQIQQVLPGVSLSPKTPEPDQIIKHPEMAGFLDHLPVASKVLIESFLTSKRGYELLFELRRFDPQSEQEYEDFRQHFVGTIFEELGYYHLNKLYSSSPDIFVLSPKEVFELYKEIHKDREVRNFGGYNLNFGIANTSYPDGLILREANGSLIVDAVIEDKMWVGKVPSKGFENQLANYRFEQFRKDFLRNNDGNELSYSQIINKLRPDVPLKPLFVNPNLDIIYVLPENSRIQFPDDVTVERIPIDSRYFAAFISLLFKVVKGDKKEINPQQEISEQKAETDKNSLSAFFEKRPNATEEISNIFDEIDSSGVIVWGYQDIILYFGIFPAYIQKNIISNGYLRNTKNLSSLHKNGLDIVLSSEEVALISYINKYGNGWVNQESVRNLKTLIEDVSQARKEAKFKDDRAETPATPPVTELPTENTIQVVLKVENHSFEIDGEKGEVSKFFIAIVEYLNEHQGEHTTSHSLFQILKDTGSGIKDIRTIGPYLSQLKKGLPLSLQDLIRIEKKYGINNYSISSKFSVAIIPQTDKPVIDHAEAISLARQYQAELTERKAQLAQLNELPGMDAKIEDFRQRLAQFEARAKEEPALILGLKYLVEEETTLQEPPTSSPDLAELSDIINLRLAVPFLMQEALDSLTSAFQDASFAPNPKAQTELKNKIPEIDKHIKQILKLVRGKKLPKYMSLEQVKHAFPELEHGMVWTTLSNNNLEFRDSEEFNTYKIVSLLFVNQYGAALSKEAILELPQKVKGMLT